MRNTKAIGRFPKFDNQFFSILKSLDIQLTEKLYVNFLKLGQRAKDIVEAASLLKDAGILTRSRYDKIVAHEDIKQIKEIFYNIIKRIKSLTKDNCDLIMNCQDSLERCYIHKFIIIKYENSTLVTDKIFGALLAHSNIQLIFEALNKHSGDLSIVNAICTLLTENLLTESVLIELKNHANPAEFSKDLKTAKFIAAAYRENKVKSGFFSCSSKASTDIVSSLVHFSTTGNYSLFQQPTMSKPGKRLQSILDKGDNAITFNRMIKPTSTLSH